MRTTDIVAAFAAFCVLVAISAAPTQAGDFTLTTDRDVAESVVVSYDPADGNLLVSGNGVELTTIELISSSAFFQPESVTDGIIQPPFDVATEAKLFHLNTGGFSELNLGSVIPPDMSGEQLIADIEVNGSILPSGSLAAAVGGGPFLYVVPEPGTMTLFLLGIALAVTNHRRRR